MQVYDKYIAELNYHYPNIRIKSIDITSLSEKETRGYKYALLLYIPLDPAYIAAQFNKSTVDYSDFYEKEHLTDEAAEWSAECIAQNGYKAYAQSERNIADSFDKNSKTSLLPHKTIAVYAGLGWIGKSNLLVTREYGSALSMCTVLTNMPCPDESSAWLESECSSCTICSEICAPKVLHDTAWTAATSRDQIVNVYECRECLQCMIQCKWTKRYALRQTQK